MFSPLIHQNVFFSKLGENGRRNSKWRKRLKTHVQREHEVCHKFFGLSKFFFFSKSFCFLFIYFIIWFSSLIFFFLCISFFKKIYQFWILRLVLFYIYIYINKIEAFLHNFLIKNVLIFVLFNRDIIVNIFSTIFHLSTFLSSKPNTHERKLNIFFPSTFLFLLCFLSSQFYTIPTKRTFKFLVRVSFP